MGRGDECRSLVGAGSHSDHPTGTRVVPGVEVGRGISDHGDSTNVLNVQYLHRSENHERCGTTRGNVAVHHHRVEFVRRPDHGRERRACRDSIEPGVQRDLDAGAAELSDRRSRSRYRFGGGALEFLEQQSLEHRMFRRIRDCAVNELSLGASPQRIQRSLIERDAERAERRA